MVNHDICLVNHDNHGQEGPGYDLPGKDLGDYEDSFRIFPSHHGILPEMGVLRVFCR